MCLVMGIVGVWIEETGELGVESWSGVELEKWELLSGKEKEEEECEGEEGVGWLASLEEVSNILSYFVWKETRLGWYVGNVGFVVW